MTPEERMNPTRCVNDFQRNHLKYIQETGVSIMHVGGSRSRYACVVSELPD
jgi:hypothetical protein